MLETLYSIEHMESADGTHVAARLALNSDHAIYRGHFPAMPVLPGVCMLWMLQDILSRALQRRLRLTHARSIKFLAVIDPRVHAALHVDADLHRRDGNAIEVNATLSNAHRVVMRFHGVFADASPQHPDAP